jgi:hypothetical protein
MLLLEQEFFFPYIELKAEIFVMAMHSGQKGGNKSKK